MIFGGCPEGQTNPVGDLQTVFDSSISFPMQGLSSPARRAHVVSTQQQNAAEFQSLDLGVGRSDRNRPIGHIKVYVEDSGGLVLC